MLMLNVPATLGLIVLAEPIVKLLFEHGRFTTADTLATAAALRLYATGLIGYAAARITSPVFYALRQSRTAVTVSVAAIAVNTALGLVLVRWMGFRGLALATAAAALLNGGLLVWLLDRRLGGLDRQHLATEGLKVCIAAGFMAAAAAGVERATSVVLPGPPAAAQGLRLLAAIGGGVAVLVASGRLLRIAELDEAFHVIRRGTDVAETDVTT
jgi:putative peptidoglycan lipid II flippase